MRKGSFVAGLTSVLMTMVTFVPLAAHAELKDALIRNFGANPDMVILNLPQRPDVLPGAVFTDNLRVPQVSGNAKDAALHNGPPLALNSDIGDLLAAGGFTGILKLAADASAVADVNLAFADAHAVDMDYPDQVVRAQTAAAVDAARMGRNPLLVVKAYLGTPNLTLTRKATATPELWGKLKADLEAANGKAMSADSVSLKASEPLIFAFEVAQLQFEPAELANGRFSIQIAPLPASLFALRQSGAQAPKPIAQQPAASPQATVAPKAASTPENDALARRVEDLQRELADTRARLDAMSAASNGALAPNAPANPAPQAAAPQVAAPQVAAPVVQPATPAAPSKRKNNLKIDLTM